MIIRDSARFGATFRSEGESVAGRELRRRGRQVEGGRTAIDCDISQATPGAPEGGCACALARPRGLAGDDVMQSALGL